VEGDFPPEEAEKVEAVGEASGEVPGKEGV
jgi:hypothetical protein